jgi:hypothetical protein
MLQGGDEAAVPAGTRASSGITKDELTALHCMVHRYLLDNGCRLSAISFSEECASVESGLDIDPHADLLVRAQPADGAPQGVDSDGAPGLLEMFRGVIDPLQEALEQRQEALLESEAQVPLWFF